MNATTTTNGKRFELYERIRQAADSVLRNAIDTGSFGPNDMDPESELSADYHRDEDGDYWYDDFWGLNQAIDELEAIEKQAIEQQPSERESDAKTSEATPGFWHIHGDHQTLISANDGRCMVGEAFESLRDYPNTGRDWPEAQANARLMAAAPEMLQALKDVSKAYQDMFDVMPVAWQTFDHIVSAAIVAAEGE